MMNQPQQPLPSTFTHYRELRLAIVGLVFILIAWRFFSDLDSVPFHGDESWWVTCGYQYTRLLLRHDFSTKDWLRPTKRNWGAILDMPVGKYFIGSAMHFALPEQDYFYIYDWAQSYQQNLARGNIPPIEVRRPGRFITAFVSYLTCLILFFYCSKLWNWVVGSIAALILAFNPVFSVTGRQVMMDTYLLFFLMLGQVAILQMIVSAKRPKRLLLVAFSGGVAAGLCGSVKVNGMVVLLHAAIALCLLSIVRFRTKQQRIWAAWAFAAFVSACVITTVLVNPFLYSWRPIVIAARYYWIVSNWPRVFAHHQAAFPASAIHGFPWIVFSRVWKDFFPLPLTACLVLGVWLCLVQAVVAIRHRSVPLIVAPLIFFFVNLIFIASLIPMDWGRYYLPILIAEVPPAAFGLFWIADKCLSTFGRRLPQF